MLIYGSASTEIEMELLRSNAMGFEIFQYTDPRYLDAFDTVHPTVARFLEGMRGVSMHGSFIDIAYTTIDPLILEVTQKRFCQSIQAASFHGAERVVFHSAYRPHNGGARSVSYVKRSIEFWKRFEENIPDGLMVLIENVEDEDPEILNEILLGIGSPKICFCFDIGHAYANSNIPLDQWIKIFDKKIAHVHIHDNDGKNDAHLPLGKGSIPLVDTINGILECAGESVPFVLECDMFASIEWLRRHCFIN